MRPSRIVIAHEEAAIRDSALEVATAAGYEAVCVADGDSARVLVFHSVPTPAALVVDVALPRMLGYELCEAISRVGLETRVILIASVYSKTAYKRRPSSLYGADDYIEQHHIVDQLADKLARVLTQPRGPTPTAASRNYGAAIRAAGEERLAFRYRNRDEALERADRLARIIAADVLLYGGDDARAWVDAGAAGPLPPNLARDLDEGRRLFELRVPAEIAAERDFVADALEDILRRNGPTAP